MSAFLNGSQRRPLVHGHRGCRGLRPENTLPAFLHAVSLGVDVLELDVVISADGQVVVSHEPWPSAAFCSTPDGVPISPGQEAAHNFYRLPYVTIRAFDCGRRRHSGFPEQAPEPAHKPLLAEVIRAADGLARQLGRPLPGYAIELKCAPAGDDIWHPAPPAFVGLVLAVLGSDELLGRTTLLAFDARVLQAARQQCPALRLCLLTEKPFAVPEIFRSLGFVPQVFGPDFTLLTLVSVLQLRQQVPGLELVPWTINHPAELDTALKWPLDGITTDYPDRLLILLGRA